MNTFSSKTIFEKILERFHLHMMLAKLAKYVLSKHSTYRIDVGAIRRPWLTFVNALANSILGRFYTARNSKICFMQLAYGIAKAAEEVKMKR